MTLTEKLNEILQYASDGNIILYKEGMFWKAYEQAAYLFVKNVKQYLVIKKNVKSAGGDITSLGFPDPALEKILAGKEYRKIEEKKIEVSIFASVINESDYAEWKSSVPLSDDSVAKKMTFENLPVYKAAYDLLLYVFRINKNVSREYKFSLVDNIKNSIISLLICVYNANTVEYADRKRETLAAASDHLVSAKLQIRILSDLHQINSKQYTSASVMIESISRQLTQWKKNV